MTAKLIYISCPSARAPHAETYARRLEEAGWRVLRWWEPRMPLATTNDAHAAIMSDYAMLDEVIDGGGVVWFQLTEQPSEGMAAEVTYVALWGGHAVISGHERVLDDPRRVAFHQRFANVEHIPGDPKGWERGEGEHEPAFRRIVGAHEALPPFSQTLADEWQEMHRAQHGVYPGHDDDCPLAGSTPFGLAGCGCGPKKP